jgi:hypothetical protein
VFAHDHKSIDHIAPCLAVPAEHNHPQDSGGLYDRIPVTPMENAAPRSLAQTVLADLAISEKLGIYAKQAKIMQCLDARYS